MLSVVEVNRHTATQLVVLKDLITKVVMLSIVTIMLHPVVTLAKLTFSTTNCPNRR